LRKYEVKSCKNEANLHNLDKNHQYIQYLANLKSNKL